MADKFHPQSLSGTAQWNGFSESVWWREPSNQRALPHVPTLRGNHISAKALIGRVWSGIWVGVCKLPQNDPQPPVDTDLLLL